jgi:hypothetical protein
MFRVAVFTLENKKYWSEGSYCYSTLPAAERAFSEFVTNGYSVVLSKGNELIKRHKIDRRNACKLGSPATVGFLK